MTAYTDFHYSPTGSGVISGAQVLEQTEQGINGLGQYVQDNVSGAIDTANEALTTARNADSNATAAINLANSLNAQIIAANQTAGNALTTAQSAQNTANSASSLAATANNNAATALNTANSASAGVTALTGTVNSLGNRMTAAENAINTNAGNITTLQNGLATTNANVTAASNAASSAQATATSAQATATSAKNAAYVVRYTGTTITGGGTIAYADIDNTDNIKAGDKIIDATGAIYDIASVDIANQTVTVGASPVINLFCDAENLIPAANDAYDLGSSNYQWNNLYAKNYYYDGVAWGLDKANVWSAIQTISYAGSNVAIALKNQETDIAASPTRNNWHYVNFYDKNSVSLGGVNYSKRTNGNSRIYLNLRTKNTNNDIVENNVFFETNQEGTDFNLYPSSKAGINLGTSTNKWKSLNGINPGALSLPDFDNADPIDFRQWDVTGAVGSNYYTPTVDGWLNISIWDRATNSIFVYRSGYERVGVFGNGSMVSDGRIALLMPVKANATYTIIIKASANSDIYSANFFPCLGNV